MARVLKWFACPLPTLCLESHVINSIKAHKTYGQTTNQTATRGTHTHTQRLRRCWRTWQTGKMPANYSYYHKLLSIVSCLWFRWAYVSYTFLTGRLSVRGKCRVPCAFKAHLCQSRSLCAHQCIKLYIRQCVWVCVSE